MSDVLENKATYKLCGIEMPLEEFDRLLCEQTNGKDLKIIDGKVVAVDHEVTDEEKIQIRKNEIQNRLGQLTQDFIQVLCGAIIDDVKERKQEFQTLHNELRYLENKEPRIYKEVKTTENEDVTEQEELEK